MSFEKKDTVKLVFALVLAITVGIGVAFGTMIFSGSKTAEATVTIPNIKVYIRGEVKNPDLYEVGADLRLCELIDMAGGTTENAELGTLNLAAVLIDGTTVTVPSKASSGEAVEPAKPTTPVRSDQPIVQTQLPEENYRTEEHYTVAVQPKTEQPESPVKTEEAATPAPSGSGSGKITSGTINLNTAGKDELMRLPGVGDATANKIISYRESSGGFMTVEEIMNVSGIGEKKFEAMKQYLAVE